METFLLSVVLIFSVAVAILSVNLVFRLLTERVPFIPSNAETTRRLLENLELSDGAVFYDLGCGDGKILAAVKKRFPGATTIGYERAWLPLVLAWLKYRHLGIQLRNADFYHADLRDATVVFCYLLPPVMQRFADFAKTALKPGTQIIAHDFPLPGWTPTKTVRSKLGAKERTTLYFYRA